MLSKLLTAATIVPVLTFGLLGSVQAAATAARCGWQYKEADLFWRTQSPSVQTVMSQLPKGKRHTSGNMMSLNYAVDAKSRLLEKAEFNKQWNYIFGKDTTTGLGQLVRGK